MQEYMNKSVEELHWEDYLSGCKGRSADNFRGSSFNPPTSSAGIGNAFGISPPAASSGTGAPFWDSGFSPTSAPPNAANRVAGSPANGSVWPTGTSFAKQGTQSVAYRPPNELDHSTSGASCRVNFHCITAMEEYINKSVEELHLEDYMSGCKGRSADNFRGSAFNPPTSSAGIGNAFAISPPAASSGTGAPFGATFRTPAPSAFEAAVPSQPKASFPMFDAAAASTGTGSGGSSRAAAGANKDSSSTLSEAVSGLMLVMGTASTTRQELEALGKLPDRLSMALEELQQDLQPPGFALKAPEVSHATEALCWSLKACRRAYQTLEAETDAIRSSLKPTLSVTENEDGDESGSRMAKEDQKELEGEEEQEEEAINAKAEDDATCLEDRVISRDDLRARLVAHLRDALKMARRRVKIDLLTAAQGPGSPASADGCIVDGDVSFSCIERSGDDAVEGKSIEEMPKPDDLESTLRCLAEWYRQSAGRCDQALKGCLVVLDDQEHQTGVAEPSSAPDGPAASWITSEDGNSAGLEDPFSNHEERLELLLNKSRNTKDAVDTEQKQIEKQLENERKTIVGLIESTDEALRKFKLLMDGGISLQPPDSHNSYELTAAAEKFIAAAKMEESHLVLARPFFENNFNTKAIADRLRRVCEARYSYLSSMVTKLDDITEELALAEKKLCAQSAALGSVYPPPVEELKEWEQRLCELQEGMERAELDLKYARRRGGDTAEFEAKRVELRTEMKAERLGVKIMRERTRLYSVAWEHFPELLGPGQDWARLVGLDSASDDQAGLKCRGLVAEGRSFADFAMVERRSAGEEGAAGSRQGVYEVTDDQGRRWALKEYSLLDDGSRRALWRHVVVLDDLRHPKLACVCAVFEDPSRGSAFVQMPWYGGDLAEWLERIPPGARSMQHCLRMLTDAAEAMEHLHRHGYVHCDIKPGNMLLTDSQQLVLSDFDVVARVEATLTRNLAGGTLGFIAPELTSGQQQQFTPPCDVYALGMVAKQLFESVAPDAEAERRDMHGALLVLIDSMTASDPKLRPTAVEICSHVALKAAGPAPKDPRSCVVCWDIRRSGAGEECSTGSHFTCSECLGRYVSSVAASGSDRKFQLAEEDGRLRCPAEDRCQGQLAPPAVLRHLDAETVEQYQSALRYGLEGRVRTTLEAGFDQERRRLQEQLQAAQLGAQEERAIKGEQAVIEDILIIKCPRCAAGIPDFDGCFALKCARCGAGLCGWCMKDCGSDSHPHVSSCRHKLAPGRYFAPRELFEESANRRRAKGVAEYVKGAPEDLRELLKERLRPHLQRLGIRVEALAW